MSSPPIPPNIATYSNALNSTEMQAYLLPYATLYLIDTPYYDVRPVSAQQAEVELINVPEPTLPGVSVNSYTQTFTSGGNTYTVAFDVFSPTLAVLGSPPLPWIYYLHGGGWLYDTNYSYYTFISEVVLQQNAIVVYVHYSLAPNTIYPGQVNECNLLFNYLLANASTYNLSPNVIIMGDSAGGNLAYHTAVANQSLIKGLIMVSPCLNPLMNTNSYVEQALNIWLPARAMALYWFEYQQTSGVTTPPLSVPTFLVISQLDVLRDEAINYATADQVNVTGVIYDGMVHDFFIAPGLVCPALLDFDSRVNAFITANL
jgi:acetyl esterase/lipase